MNGIVAISRCNLAYEEIIDNEYSWKWYRTKIFGTNLGIVWEKNEKNIANIYPFINDLVHFFFFGVKEPTGHLWNKLLAVIMRNIFKLH